VEKEIGEYKLHTNGDTRQSVSISLRTFVTHLERAMNKVNTEERGM